MEKIKDITHKAKDQAKDALNEVKHGGVQGNPPSAQHDGHHTTSTGHGNTTTSSTGGYGNDLNSRSTNAGPHDSNLANKADPRVDSDRDGSRNAGLKSSGQDSTGYGNTTSTTGGYGDNNNSRSTNNGPHDSNTGNKLDPRFDSDGDHRQNAGLQSGNYNNNTTTTSGTTDGYGENPRSTNHGPHSSNLANKADYRVDSDGDRSGNAGLRNDNQGYGNTSTTGGYGDNPRSSNNGPHSSNLANKADFRVDSDGDRSGNAGLRSDNQSYGNTTSSNYGTNTTSTTGGYGDSTRSTNAGPHNSNLANKADPRVDSDRDGSRNAGMNNNSNNTGYGNTTGTHGDNSLSKTGKTSGPHNSDTMNRMDPRVDSRPTEL